TPGTGTAPGAANPLTGHWVGNAGNGEGLAGVISLEGVTCTYQFDITADLVQTGSALSGTGSSVARGLNCSIPLPPGFVGMGGSGTLSGTASNGTLSFQVGPFTFNGTYTSTRIDATSTAVIEGATVNWTWRQTKQ